MPKGTTYQAGSVAINMILNSAQFSAAIDKAKNAMSGAGVAMTRTMKMIQAAAHKMQGTFSAVTSGIIGDLKGLGNAFKGLASAAITPSSWIKGFAAIGASITAATVLAVNHRLEMQKVADTYRHTSEEMSIFTYISASTGVEYEKLADTLREIQIKANEIIEAGSQAASTMGVFFKETGGAKSWAQLKDPLEVLIKFRTEYQKLVDTKGRGTATAMLDEISDSASECRKVLELTTDEFNRLVTMGAGTAVSTANIEKFTSKFKELFEIGERFLVGIVNNIAPAFTSLIDEWYAKVETVLNGGGDKTGGMKKAFQDQINEWSNTIFDYLTACLDSLSSFLVSMNKLMNSLIETYNKFSNTTVASMLGIEGTTLPTYDEKTLSPEDKKQHDEIQGRKTKLEQLKLEEARNAALYNKREAEGVSNKDEEQVALAKRQYEIRREIDALNKQAIKDGETQLELNTRNTDAANKYLDTLTKTERAQYDSNQAVIAKHTALLEERSIIESKQKGRKKGTKEANELEAHLKRVNGELKTASVEASNAAKNLDAMGVKFDFGANQLKANRAAQTGLPEKYAGYKELGGAADGLSSKVASGATASDALKAASAFADSINAQRQKITDFMEVAQGKEMSALRQREIAEKKSLTALYDDMKKETDKYYKDQIEKNKSNKAEVKRLEQEHANAIVGIEKNKNTDLDRLAGFQKVARLKGMTETSKEIEKQIRDIEERYQLHGQSSQYTSEREQIERALDESLKKMKEEYKEYLDDVNSEEYKLFVETQEKKKKILEEYDKEALNRYLDTAKQGQTASMAMAQSKGKGESPFPGMSVSDIEASKGNVNQQTEYALKMGDALMAESASKNKKMFEMKKKMDIATAIMSTYNAANAAMTASPGPAGWAMAAMTVAMGLMNVKNISAQEWVGQAHDGIDYVPNEGTWNLAKGERVLSSTLNRDVTEMTRRVNSGELSGRGNVSISAPMHIEGNVVDEGWFDSKLKAHRDSIAGLVSEYNSDRGI